MTSTNAVHFVIRAGRADAVALADSAETLFARSDWTVTRSVLGDERETEPSVDAAVNAVIAFGGDGTFLEAVRIAYPVGAKVGGINLGRLGYLAGFEAGEASTLFERVLNDPESATNRTMLEVTPASLVEAHADAFFALNEMTLEKTDPGHLTRLRVEVNGVPFATYSADGIIVATPTGSTAYSLSARGPIISPNVNCLVLVPVAPHMLFDRAMVIAASEQVTFVAEREAILTADGRVRARLLPGESLTCTVAAKPLSVFEPVRDFHQVLRRKFNLVELEC